jgi:hypothetical protein
MMDDNDFLPTLVGFMTTALEHEGIGLDLQVAMTMEDQLNRRFYATKLAMSAKTAMDLAGTLIRTVESMRLGQEPLQ